MAERQSLNPQSRRSNRIGEFRSYDLVTLVWGNGGTSRFELIQLTHDIIGMTLTDSASPGVPELISHPQRRCRSVTR